MCVCTKRRLQAKNAKIYTIKPRTSTSASLETLKIYNKCFETAYLGENVINLLMQKVAQNVAISLGYSIFRKIPTAKILSNLVTLHAK